MTWFLCSLPDRDLAVEEQGLQVALLYLVLCRPPQRPAELTMEVLCLPLSVAQVLKDSSFL